MFPDEDGAYCLICGLHFYALPAREYQTEQFGPRFRGRRL